RCGWRTAPWCPPRRRRGTGHEPASRRRPAAPRPRRQRRAPAVGGHQAARRRRHRGAVDLLSRLGADRGGGAADRPRRETGRHPARGAAVDPGVAVGAAVPRRAERHLRRRGPDHRPRLGGAGAGRAAEVPAHHRAVDRAARPRRHGVVDDERRRDRARRRDFGPPAAGAADPGRRVGGRAGVGAAGLPDADRRVPGALRRAPVAAPAGGGAPPRPLAGLVAGGRRPARRRDHRLAAPRRRDGRRDHRPRWHRPDLGGAVEAEGDRLVGVPARRGGVRHRARTRAHGRRDQRRRALSTAVTVGGVTATVDADFLELPRAALADAALSAARAAGASYADLRIHGITTELMSLRDGELETAVVDREIGLAVRVIVDGTWGFASHAELSADVAAETARRAVRVARTLAPLNTERIELAPEPVYRDVTWVSDYAIDPFTVSTPDKLAVLGHYSGRLLAADGVDHVSASWHAAKEQTFYADTFGSSITQQRVRVQPSLEAVTVDAAAGTFETMRTLAPPTARGWEYA